jgi:hypothetical protein
MRFFIYISLFSISLLFCASIVEAKDVVYKKSWKVNKNAQEIVAILTDYNNYCDKGCKYRSPSVKKSVVLPYQKTDSSFYMWTFVEDTKDSKWFSHVTITQSGNRTIVLSTMLLDKQAEELAKISKRPNAPVFDDCVSRYEITEIFRDGQFVSSEISFIAKVTISGLISLFSGQVESGLEESGKAIINNITKGGSK